MPTSLPDKNDRAKPNCSSRCGSDPRWAGRPRRSCCQLGRFSRFLAEGGANDAVFVRHQDQFGRDEKYTCFKQKIVRKSLLDERYANRIRVRKMTPMDQRSKCFFIVAI